MNLLSPYEMPLGISEEYDQLPLVNTKDTVCRCSDCDGTFLEGLRFSPTGGRCRTIFCAECREKRRIQFRAQHVQLPQAIIVSRRTK